MPLVAKDRVRHVDNTKEPLWGVIVRIAAVPDRPPSCRYWVRWPHCKNCGDPHGPGHVNGPYSGSVLTKEEVPHA